MTETGNDGKVVRCEQPNGIVSYVPVRIFKRVLYEMDSEEENLDIPRKYVTYKIGAKMYCMSEKFFREWTNKIGATKHISENKVIVDVKMVESYLKYL